MKINAESKKRDKKDLKKYW